LTRYPRQVGTSLFFFFARTYLYCVFADVED
jgi:hypothetical protein